MRYHSTWVCLAAIPAAFLTTPVGGTNGKEPPRVHYIAAKINYQILTRSDVEQAWRRHLLDNGRPAQAVASELGQIMADHDAVERGEALDEGRNTRYREFLRRLMRQRLIEQLRSHRVGESKEDIDKTNKGYPDWLEEKENASLDALIRQMRFRAGVDEDDIGPEEIRAYYYANRDLFSPPVEVQIRQIVVLFKNHKTEEAARARAEAILRQLDEGADFAQLATEVSEGPRAGSGGLWDPLPKGSLEDSIETFAFSPPTGRHSGLLKSKVGFHIAKIERILAGLPEPFEVVEPTIREKLLGDQFTERMNQWLGTLNEKVYVWTMFDRRPAAEAAGTP